MATYALRWRRLKNLLKGLGIGALAAVFVGCANYADEAQQLRAACQTGDHASCIDYETLVRACFDPWNFPQQIGCEGVGPSTPMHPQGMSASALAATSVTPQNPATSAYPQAPSAQGVPSVQVAPAAPAGRVTGAQTSRNLNLGAARRGADSDSWVEVGGAPN